MNKFGEFVLKGLRKVYTKTFNSQSELLSSENDPDKASEIISGYLLSDKPCMIARFGSTELNAISNWHCVKYKKKSILRFIKGGYPQWWWNELALKQLETHSGFFPSNIETVERFSRMMINDMSLVDVLGSWRPEEVYFSSELRFAQKVKLLWLEPYWSKMPWSRTLEGKRVLVVHPFAEDIISQYNNRRELIFKDKKVLPRFASLRVIKAVQSLGGESNGFKDWFEALEWMKEEMDKEPYDIALVGCGAYGFPLAAYAKRTGHKAVHLGGALQLLFGIKGQRWENINYGVKRAGIRPGVYLSLMNEYWIRPCNSRKPLNAEQVEGGCYW